MPAFRLYLRTNDGRIICRDDFEAQDARTAQSIAETVFDACSDLAQVYELWDHNNPVCAARHPVTVPDAKSLKERTQQIVVDREIALRDSRWAVAQSERLLRKIAEWAECPLADTPISLDGV